MHACDISITKYICRWPAFDWKAALFNLLLCGLWGCKKGPASFPGWRSRRTKPGCSFVFSSGNFFCFVFTMYVVFCLLVFGCPYQCIWLPGKTRLQNDLLCVKWDVKPYAVADSFTCLTCFCHTWYGLSQQSPHRSLWQLLEGYLYRLVSIFSCHANSF